MSTELSMVVACSVLCALLFAPYTLAGVGTAGLAGTVGNRASPLPLPEWAERARRAHQNLVENLPHFAALVLVAVAAGRTNDITAVAASVFFWARLAHAGLYVAGVPWLRTAAFLVGLGSEGVILTQLL